MSGTPGQRRTRLGVTSAIVLVVAALMVAVVIGMIRTAATPVDEIPLDATTPKPAAVYVHVHGAVEHPGLYRLMVGARVVDLVAAAGGFADDAEQSGVNLAREISDGEQLKVPRIGDTAEEAPDAAGGRIDLNNADVDELDTLPRIGPALAARIIQWREQNGRFTSVDDLLAVPGIGDKMLQALRELVTV